MHFVVTLLSLLLMLTAPLTTPEGALMASPAVSEARQPVEASRVPVPADEEYRGSVNVMVRFVPAATVPLLCGAPGHPIIACVNDIGGDLITLPNPCAPEFIGEDYAAVVCHEKGHILGWEHQMPSVYPTPESIHRP